MKNLPGYTAETSLHGAGNCDVIVLAQWWGKSNPGARKSACEAMCDCCANIGSIGCCTACVGCDILKIPLKPFGGVRGIRGFF